MRNFTLTAFAVSLLASGCCFGPSSSPRVVEAPPPAPAPRPAPAAAPAPAPAPAPALKKGEKVTIALNVQFETSRHEVRPQYDGKLSEVAEFLKKYPGSRAEIEGHTDSMGDAEANRALSQRRADAVRQALIDRFGADAGRLTARGYGEDKPLADNGTAAGRTENRRVVATFSSAD